MQEVIQCHRLYGLQAATEQQAKIQAILTNGLILDHVDKKRFLQRVRQLRGIPSERWTKYQIMKMYPRLESVL
jgi:aspartate carbamoyltransferase regulatory subunit